MRSISNKRRKFTAAALAVTVGFSFGGCGGGGSAGFLGLDDFARDVVTGAVGSLAGALLSNALPPPADDGAGLTIRTIPGPAGRDGQVGRPGLPGPTLFSMFADKFFGAQFVDGFEPVPVPNDGPALTQGAGPIGYRFLIPSIFASENGDGQPNAQSNMALTPITMRLFLRRFGECNGGCFVFTVDGRRLRSGDSEPRCYGGVEADCADGTMPKMSSAMCVLSTGGCGGGGFLGMQDYQRDLLFGVGGGLTGALISNNAPPAPDDSEPDRVEPGPQGSPGAEGPPGPPGPALFANVLNLFDRTVSTSS